MCWARKAAAALCIGRRSRSPTHLHGARKVFGRAVVRVQRLMVHSLVDEVLGAQRAPLRRVPVAMAPARALAEHVQRRGLGHRVRTILLRVRCVSFVNFKVDSQLVQQLEGLELSKPTRQVNGLEPVDASLVDVCPAVYYCRG